MVPAMKPSLFPSRSLGAREVRALAHPLRLRMLESLHDGPATASMLARELGESSGATSYHLRALAAAGLIVEDLDRRKGRERWWKREPWTPISSVRTPEPSKVVDAIRPT